MIMNGEQTARQTFLDEARELLQELEASLLDLEQDPADREIIDRTFRALHTIKGSGAMFGFDEVAEFTHEVETVFDRVREGELHVTGELLTLTLAARDHIQFLLDEPSADSWDRSGAEAIMEQLRSLVPSKEIEHSGNLPVEKDSCPPVREARALYRIRFEPFPEFLRNGTNPLYLLNELESLGKATIIGNMDNVPALPDLDPESCHTFWDILLDTCSGENAIRDVFIFVDDACRLDIRLIDSGEGEGLENVSKKLGEILVERGDVQPEDIERVLKKQKRIGDLLEEDGIVSRERVASALVEQDAVRELRKSKEQNAAGSSIRVAATKLDSLVNLVGELVIVQARITQQANTGRDPVLESLAEELERLSNELRDSTLSIRMVPIGSTFGMLRRLVRDLSSELGKEIELVTEGADTELDKTVIERLNDPLVHLLRNSIDHGIEESEGRLACGKPARGTITLTAEHAGGEVVIRIIDDGRGIDPEAVRAKALERGLIQPAQDVSERDLLALVFEPGFSTAQTISNVSGRGVGMDVVKRSIESLRGSINIESAKGNGTAVSIRLPLTLAIIEGLLVQAGQEYFVLPLAVVHECLEMERGKENRQELVEVRGELIPYVRLRDWFDIDGECPRIEQVVITGANNERIGIMVDQVIGEHQTVIKPLGKLFRAVRGVSGTTINADGTMALILDVAELAVAAYQEEVTTWSTNHQVRAGT
jgi:two-component system, chemotaxis family, sensor kinase CheA